MGYTYDYRILLDIIANNSSRDYLIPTINADTAEYLFSTIKLPLSTIDKIIKMVNTQSMRSLGMIVYLLNKQYGVTYDRYDPVKLAYGLLATIEDTTAFYDKGDLFDIIFTMSFSEGGFNVDTLLSYLKTEKLYLLKRAVNTLSDSDSLQFTSDIWDYIMEFDMLGTSMDIELFFAIVSMYPRNTPDLDYLLLQTIVLPIKTGIGLRSSEYSIYKAYNRRLLEFGASYPAQLDLFNEIVSTAYSINPK